jgi:hypothetical protein
MGFSVLEGVTSEPTKIGSKRAGFSRGPPFDETTEAGPALDDGVVFWEIFAWSGLLGVKFRCRQTPA